MSYTRQRLNDTGNRFIEPGMWIYPNTFVKLDTMVWRKAMPEEIWVRFLNTFVNDSVMN